MRKKQTACLIRVLTAIHILSLAGRAWAQFGTGAPYTNDAYTIVLDHFDNSSSANLLGAINDGAPCGAQKPAATPNFSFGPGAAGFNQALALYAPLGTPAGSRSYLKYPGELLCQSNGTMECWIYLSDYTFYFHQLNYLGECQGDVGGLSVDSNGQLQASLWYTIFDPVSLDSGTNTVPLNIWTHVALSWGLGGVKLYINGTVVGANSNTGSFADWFGLDSVFVLLGEGSKIDELRISNVQRTTANKPPATLAIQRYAGLTITGQPGTTYQIQYTTNLGSPTNWVTLTNLTLPTSPYLYFDASSPTRPSSFYRAVAVQ